MSNNTTLNTGTGGDTIQTIDNTTYKTQVVALANSTGANTVAVDASGRVPVTVATSLPAGTNNIGFMQQGALATGSISGTTSSAISCLGLNTVVFYKTGTFTGTLISEGTFDGTNWVTLPDVSTNSSGVAATQTAWYSGTGVFPCTGMQQVRIRCSAYTSGTLTTTLTATPQFWTGAQTAQGEVSINLTKFAGTGINNGGTGGGIAVGGAVASGSAANTQPVNIGGMAATANPTAVANAQVVRSMHDKMGRQVVVQGHVRDLVGKQATTITSSTTATTIITAGGASVFTDITRLTVTNGSATATTVTLSDGTYSEIHNLPAGGGFVIPFTPPLPATTANTAWTLACGTLVASVYVGATYVKNL